jgi:hypothetical protein
MYAIEFNGEAVYIGDDRHLAQTIATAFAHAYGVSGWGRKSLILGFKFGDKLFTESGLLGHNAIEKVNDFFAHY